MQKIDYLNHEVVEGTSQVILKLFLETIHNSLRSGLRELPGIEDIVANHACLNRIQWPTAACQLFHSNCPFHLSL